MKYKKKPVEIEAIELTPINVFEVTAFIDGKRPDIGSDIALDKFGDYERLVSKRGYININTLEGVMKACFGDYIIKGVKGEFYPCKPDVFAMTYDAI
jgi:hypothetical protein